MNNTVKNGKWKCNVEFSFSEPFQSSYNFTKVNH